MVRCLNVNEALGGRVRQGHVLTRKKHAEGTMRGAAPGFDTMLLDNRERFAVTLSINPDGTKTCIINAGGTWIIKHADDEVVEVHDDVLRELDEDTGHE